MGGFVGVVPGELLGQEVLASRFGDQLRQGGGVAEDIGQPQLASIDAELLHEEAFAVQKLARQRFA